MSGIKLFGATIRLQEEQESEGEIEMKRAEEIIACPRCSSMETKFCYFNNYNVNQPRHFCKGCQRYWTAGGALRNVPVGAGRRRARPPSRDQLQGAFLYGAAGLAFWDNGVVEDWHDFPVKRRRTNSGGQESST